MATHRPFIFNSLKPTDKSVKIYSNKKYYRHKQESHVISLFQCKIKKK